MGARENLQLPDVSPLFQEAAFHNGLSILAKQELPYDLSEWMADFREMAKRPNVVCKLSGLPLESKLPGWQESDFQPCIDLALECFGPDRLMFGSDWPPCLMATRYERWVTAVEAALGSLSSDEQSAIWHRTAERVCC